MNRKYGAEKGKGKRKKSRRGRRRESERQVISMRYSVREDAAFLSYLSCMKSIILPLADSRKRRRVCLTVQDVDVFYILIE